MYNISCMIYINEYLKMQEENWWFVSRNSIILNLIKKYKSKDKKLKILDVGCACGNLLFYLREKGFENLYGIDYNKKLIENIDFKDIKVTEGDAQKTDFEENFFDVIVSSDSLEHMDDDLAVLKEMKRILNKDGILIVFVPAFNFLWSYHDVINQHKRRYNLRDLYKKVETAGFYVKKISYWNFFMFFPAVLVRFLKNILSVKSNDFYRTPSFINGLIISVLSIENLFLNFLNFPFGVSVFAVCGKGEIK